VAQYNWSNIKVEFDNSSGTLVDMSQYITSINGVKINAPTVDVTPLGSSAGGWQKNLFGGLLQMDEITIEGFYDDTASTGPDAIFKDLGCVATSGGTRTLKVTWGGTKYTQVETIITGYDRTPSKGQPTMFTVTLTATGAVTEV